MLTVRYTDSGGTSWDALVGVPVAYGRRVLHVPASRTNIGRGVCMTTFTIGRGQIANGPPVNAMSAKSARGPLTQAEHDDLQYAIASQLITHGDEFAAHVRRHNAGNARDAAPGMRPARLSAVLLVDLALGRISETHLDVARSILEANPDIGVDAALAAAQGATS